MGKSVLVQRGYLRSNHYGSRQKKGWPQEIADDVWLPSFPFSDLC